MPLDVDMPTSNSASIASQKKQARLDFLQSKYGNDPKMWKKASAVSLIGGELIEGMAEYNNAKLQMESIARRQDEIAGRAKISIANILQQGQKIEGAQTTAFAKAGVKMEGSALNVLAETATKAVEAARVKQRETDFELSQQEALRETLKVKQKFAIVDTLIGVGGTVAMSQIK